jgi:hypothetical protein
VYVTTIISRNIPLHVLFPPRELFFPVRAMDGEPCWLNEENISGESHDSVKPSVTVPDVSLEGDIMNYFIV